MQFVRFFSILMVLLAGSASANNWGTGEHDMVASPAAYNRIVLPSPFHNVVIPPSAQLQERPLPLNNNRGLLIRPRAGADDIPVLIELSDGEVFTVNIKTDNSKKTGQVFRYRSAPDKSTPPANAYRAHDDFIARVMSNAIEGSEPRDMGSVALGRSMALTIDMSQTACQCYPELLLKSKASYRGAGHYLNVYQLSSDRLIEVDPRDFWRDGVVAVTIQGDVAGPGSSPLMAILEVDSE